MTKKRTIFGLIVGGIAIGISVAVLNSRKNKCTYSYTQTFLD